MDKDEKEKKQAEDQPKPSGNDRLAREKEKIRRHLLTVQAVIDNVVEQLEKL